MPNYVIITWIVLCGIALSAALILDNFLAETAIILMLTVTIVHYARRLSQGRPSNRYSRLMRGLVMALGLAAAIALPYGGWNLFEAWSSTHWPQVQGTISLSRIIRNSGKSGPTYRPEVSYIYEVAGKRYTGHRFGFPGPISGQQSLARFEVSRYPAGNQVPVFYNVGSPENAVLEPGITEDTWFAPVFGLIALSIAAVMILKNRRNPEW
jgi:hypothetical protein